MERWEEMLTRTHERCAKQDSNDEWERRVSWLKSVNQTEDLMDSMENQWSPSKWFLRDKPYHRSPRNPKVDVRIELYTGKALHSCRFSSTSCGEMKKRTLFRWNETTTSKGAWCYILRCWSFLGLVQTKKCMTTNGVKLRRRPRSVDRTGSGRKSLHFCADGETMETILRTIVCANQLSIHGAVAEECEKVETGWS